MAQFRSLPRGLVALKDDGLGKGNISSYPKLWATSMRARGTRDKVRNLTILVY
jgi:hypothetical protein